MNPATARASGTKPSNLINTIPGASEENASEAGVDAELKNLSKMKPQPQPQQDQAQRDPAETDPLAALDAQFADVPSDNSKAPASVSQFNAQGSKDLGDQNMVAPPPTDKQNANAIDFVQQGIPTAVSAMSTIGGAAAGAASSGVGVGLGAKGGQLAGAAINTALAPYYRDIANKLRDHFGIPKDETTDEAMRSNAAFGEAIGLAIPAVFHAGAFAKDFVGGKLAAQEGEQVAKNIAAAQVAKNNGIPIDTTQVFKNTQFDPEVMMLKANPNLSAVGRAFEDYKNAVGSEVDKDGKLVIKPETVEKRTRETGKQLEELRKQAIAHDDGQLYNPAPILQGMKEAMEVHGIKTVNGEIPDSVFEKLTNEQKALANKYNQTIQKIQEVHLENNSGTTLSTEQLKYARKPAPSEPNFNGAPDQNAGAQFQDVIPPEQMNTGATMAVSGASNPLNASTQVTNTPGVQGSLGLAEQSDHMNTPMFDSANGQKLTRAQVLAQTSNIPLYETGGVQNRGMNLGEIMDLTKQFQDLANFNSASRSVVDKQFGSIAKTAGSMRNEIVKNVFDRASSQAEESGNAALASNLKDSAERLKNLSQQFGDLKDVGPKLIKSMTDDPVKATEHMMRSLDIDEFKAAMRSFSDQEKGALKSAYVRNLIDDSTKGKVLLDPKTIENAVYKDRDRVKLLFGDDHYEQLMGLVKSAKNAATIDGKYSDKAVPAEIVSRFAKYTGKLGATGLDLVNNLLLRAPNIRDAVKESPSYIEAFEKYYGGKSVGQKVAASKDLVGANIAGSTAVKAVQLKNNASNSTDRLKKRNDELKMLDLDIGK